MQIGARENFLLKMALFFVILNITSEIKDSEEVMFVKFKGLIIFLGPLKGLPLNSFEIYGLGGLLPPKIRR